VALSVAAADWSRSLGYGAGRAGRWATSLDRAMRAPSGPQAKGTYSVSRHLAVDAAERYSAGWLGRDLLRCVRQIEPWQRQLS